MADLIGSTLLDTFPVEEAMFPNDVNEEPTLTVDPTVLGPYYDMLAYVIMVQNEYIDPFAALPSTLDVLRIVVLNFEQIPAFQIKSHLHV